MNFTHDTYGEAEGISCDGKEVLMITDYEGQIVYVKPDSGLIMLYHDEKTNKDTYHCYSIEETTQTLRVTNEYGLLELAEPFKTQLNNNKNNLYALYDTSREITAVNGVYQCPYLTSVSLPAVKKQFGLSFQNCTNLIYSNMSSLCESNGHLNLNTKLKYFYVDSETYRSLDSGFGDSNQILALKQDEKYHIASVVPLATKLSNDNIVGFTNSLRLGSSITDVYFKNLTSFNSTAWYSGNNLTNIVIDNDQFRSISPTEGSQIGKRLIVVGKTNPTDEMGTQLKAISPVLTSLTYSPTSIEVNCFYTQRNNLKYVNIGGNYNTYENKIVTTNDDKTLILALNDTKSYDLIQQKTELTCLGKASLNNCTKRIDIFHHEGIKKVEQVAFRRFNALSISLPNLTTAANYFGADNVHTTYCYFPELTSLSDQGWRQSDLINRNLTAFDAPKVQSIGSAAFKSNPLISAYYPIASSVGNNAFEDCPNLRTVNLSSCTSWGNNMFIYCFGLEELWCNSITIQQMKDMQSRISIKENCVCHCSDGDYIVIY